MHLFYTFFFEIKRVAKNNTDIIFGIPSDNIFMKLFFWYKKSPALQSHINSKKRLIKIINNNYNVKRKKVLRIAGVDVYTTVMCNKK